MGGFFGVTSHRDCIIDVFFGVDYHSHLGTKRAGMAAVDCEKGFQREIHNISNTPFRTKFDAVPGVMTGNACIGCISDSDPQPILIRSHFGTYAISTVGRINNSKELVDMLLESGCHFNAMDAGKVNDTELIAAIINHKGNFADGIKYVHEVVDGTASILILKEDGNLIAARDNMGRLPVLIAKDSDGYAVSFESFAYEKLGYEQAKELGSAEIVEISPDEIKVLSPAKKKKKICSFLWTYYGFPNSTYEGVNVETMRYKNGEIMAQADKESNTAQDLDYVSGIPDSGTPHAIGYSNKAHVPFARPFIKYTPTWPRSFTPSNQTQRKMIARMKQIPVHNLIKGKKLLFVDDSIVRGTQLGETVSFLYDHGAKDVHMRSACPPIMFGCKYLNFSNSRSEMELITRQVIMELEGEEGFKYIDEYLDGKTERGKAMRQAICNKFHFASLEYQSLEGLIKSIGLEECELCTYCCNGKE